MDTYVSLLLVFIFLIIIAFAARVIYHYVVMVLNK